MTRFSLWLLRFLHKHYPTQRRDARCSFCGRSYAEAEPFAEGEYGSMICGDCVRSCGELIAAEKARRASVVPAAVPKSNA